MGPVAERDVSQAEFEDRVIARSSVVPIVVDFWAAWCQPCCILSPTLDRLEQSADGAWELVKVDIDREPVLANRYRITSIPALKGFRDGQVVAEMLGAQPESAIRAFLTRLVPSEADRLVSDAEDVLRSGNLALAEGKLREALSMEPAHGRGLLALGSLLFDYGRLDEAAAVLEQIPFMTDEGAKARTLLSRLLFRREAANLGAVDARQSDETPADAHWAAGNAAAAAGDFREALDHFLWLVENDRRYRDDGGRRLVLAVFDILGPGDPTTLEFRPRLSSLLF